MDSLFLGMLQISLKFYKENKKVILGKTEHEVEPAQLEPECLSYHHYIYLAPNIINWDTGKLVVTEPNRDNIDVSHLGMLKRKLICLYVQKHKSCKYVA